MKPIKFDLPMNGAKIATLEQLKENLTPEILESFRSGKLAKWLRVRNLIEQANQIDSLLVNDAKHEMELVKSLYQLFDTELNETVLQTALAEYKKLSPSLNNGCDDEIEQLKAELAKKELEIEQLKNPPIPEVIETRIGNFIVREEGTATDTKTGLMWCRYAVGQRWEDGAVVGDDTLLINWDDAMKAAESFNLKAINNFTDWRLPTIVELDALLSQKRTDTTFAKQFDNIIFPLIHRKFWSFSAYDANYAWVMDFNTTHHDWLGKNNHYAVLLVRG